MKIFKRNKYTNTELRTIYFALVDRLQQNKEEFEDTKDIELVEYMDYLNKLIDKTQELIKVNREGRRIKNGRKKKNVR